MLELLATVDPLAAIMGGLWLFAAGMFPVAFMLGSTCSACCGCNECTEGELPDTVTVTISGYVDGTEQGPDLAFLTFQSDFGSGAAGKVTAPNGDPDTEAGPITAVTLTSNGTGYARIARVEPTLTAEPDANGTGAIIDIELYQMVYQGRAAWGVSDLTLVDGGSGYNASGTLVNYIADAGDTVVSSGFFTYESDGNGTITSVTAGESGVYYREDSSLPGELAAVTVGVAQSGPTAATAAGATFSVDIDDDTASPTFGQITAVPIVTGGDDYLAWMDRKTACCAGYWNDKTVVLKRQGCVFGHSFCGTGCPYSTVTVEYRGPDLPLLVTISDGACSLVLESDSLVSDCDALSVTASNTTSAVSATVEAGGTYVEPSGILRCFSCCRGSSDPPEEISVELRALAFGTVDEWGPPTKLDDVPTIVLQRDAACEWWTGSVGFEWLPGVPISYGVEVSLQECSDPAEIDCDDCWGKCVTQARVTTLAAGQNGSSTGYGGDQLCDQCDARGAESPVCAPSTGDYIIENNDFNQGVWYFGVHEKAKVTIL